MATVVVSFLACLTYMEVLSSLVACGPDDSGGGQSSVDAGLSVDAGSGGAAGSGGTAGSGGSGGNVCPFSDPADLGTDPAGDPALDLSCASTGVTTTGRPWVRLKFMGPWLPSNDFYSWFAKITLMSSTGELGSYTRQRHAGVDDTLVTGGVDAAGTTFTLEPNGCVVVFDAKLAAQIVSASIKSGMLQTQTSSFLEDGVNVTPFDATVGGP